MADEGKSRLEIWLDFAKALIWPMFTLILLLMFGKSIAKQLQSMIDALEHSGGQVAVGPSGVSISVLAQQEQKVIQAKISEESKPTSPSDPVPSEQAIVQIQALNTLQTLARNGSVSQTFGWIYCGQLVDGHWRTPPNLKITGMLSLNQTYTISTDTYLRESPPQDDKPKGQVIGVVPEGQEVKVLQLTRVPDKEQMDANAVLIWVKIENKGFYGLRKR